MSAVRVTKVFKAWHAPRLQPEQRVQPWKRRNVGADQARPADRRRLRAGNTLMGSLRV